ncbi:WD40 repeat domain-containing protein, partial [Escherichia coli]
MELWDASTGQAISSLRHDGTVTDAYFVHNGTGIITVSDDKCLRLWDSVSGALVAILRGHDDVILQARMSPDETRVITTSKDKTIRLWDVSTGTSARIMQLWDAPIRTRDSILIDSQQSYSAAFSPGEPRAVVST